MATVRVVVIVISRVMVMTVVTVMVRETDRSMHRKRYSRRSIG